MSRLPHRRTRIRREPHAPRLGAGPSSPNSRRAVWQALAALHPHDRTLLLLREFHRLSYFELARVLEVTPRAAAKQLRRAQHHFAQELARRNAPAERTPTPIEPAVPAAAAVVAGNSRGPRRELVAGRVAAVVTATKFAWAAACIALAAVVTGATTLPAGETVPPLPADSGAVTAPAPVTRTIPGISGAGESSNIGPFQVVVPLAVGTGASNLQTRPAATTADVPALIPVIPVILPRTPETVPAAPGTPVPAFIPAPAATPVPDLVPSTVPSTPAVSPASPDNVANPPSTPPAVPPPPVSQPPGSPTPQALNGQRGLCNALFEGSTQGQDNKAGATAFQRLDSGVSVDALCADIPKPPSTATSPTAPTAQLSATTATSSHGTGNGNGNANGNGATQGGRR